MFYKELGLILIIVILLSLMFFLEGRLPLSSTGPIGPTASAVAVEEATGPIGPEAVAAVAAVTAVKAVKAKKRDPEPVEAIKQPSDHSYPFPRMMDGYLDDTMLQRPCTSDGDCISGNCGQYKYCAAQYKKLVPSSAFLYSDNSLGSGQDRSSSNSFGSWLN